MNRLLITVLAAIAAVPAVAGPASDAVRFFYVPVRWEADPEFRGRFIEPAKTLFDLNDTAPEGEIGCVDFGPGIDAQDFDDATIKSTLKLDEQVEADAATVTATFQLFPGDDGGRREMRWSLRNVGGEWKVSDIESVTSGWKLSELNCFLGQQ